MTHTPARLQSAAPRFSMTGRMVAMSPGEDGLIGIPFPEHSNELLSRLNAQRRSGLLCDLTLTSRGARYPTHRAVMAAVSLYFRRLFGADDVGVAGEVGGGCSVCQLDCVSPDALDALLEFAYTATLTIRSSGMREVLEGAQLLGIQCVADACRHILGEAGEVGEADEVIQESLVIKERKAPSRRKQDRRNVEKAESPMCPAWRNTRTEEDTPTCEASPTPECKPRLLQNGFVRIAQRGPLINGSHQVPRPVKDPPPEEEESNHKGGVIVQSSLAPPQADTMVGGTTEGVAKKRKPQTPQQCPVCQKIIHGAGKLPRHMRTHTGEKPFQCSACGVRFTRNDKLKIHMRKHTGERPYSCPSCPARFLHSYDLKNHLSLHSGTRPYECSLCHKAFTREDHLQRHRKGLACLELCPRRPRHVSSPHSPLPAPAAAHFQLREDAETSGGMSLIAAPPLVPGEITYPRVLHWRAIEERERGSRTAALREEEEVQPKTN